MKHPEIYTNKPIFSQGDYDVHVGALEKDRLPMYVVVNRNTGVVEFTSEVTLGYLSWLDGIDEATKQRQLPGGVTGQVPLDFAKAN